MSPADPGLVLARAEIDHILPILPEDRVASGAGADDVAAVPAAIVARRVGRFMACPFQASDGRTSSRTAKGAGRC
jgi:hypothetical protein